ncbi:MAG: acyl-CoA reductase [Candidatus Nanopelagicales bacterium]
MTTLRVPHFAKGRLVEGTEVEHSARDKGTTFATPAIVLGDMVYGRNEDLPAFGVKMGEIIDLLVATGAALDLDRNAHLQRALDAAEHVNAQTRRVLEFGYRMLPGFFDRGTLTAEVALGLGDSYDDWRSVDVAGREYRVLACPARMAHVLAGNGPGSSALSIIRGALSRGVHLLKLPSNELMAATAILATMADIEPDHPVVRSFSGAYWRGGDRSLESVIYRPQFIDKIVAWGGEEAIKNVQGYLGPGVELVAMDPKLSISMVGNEALASDASVAEAAEATALDVGNQEACNNTRFVFVEGALDDVDRYCAALVERLGVERPRVDAVGPPTPSDIRDEVDVLRHMAPDFRVWGDFTGRGLVVRSSEPVDFNPASKTVNVVHVSQLSEAVRYVNTSTQTVAVYPSHRKADLRDGLASAGVQRIATSGQGFGDNIGLPHDGMLVLNRLVRWVVENG